MKKKITVLNYGPARSGAMITLGIGLLMAANLLLRGQLPGTHAEIRPQAAIIFLAGYLWGPLAGFLTGFLGNAAFDLAIGHGTGYLLSWSLGNGLLGLVSGLSPLRRQRHLEGLGQVFRLLFTILLANLIFVCYAFAAAGVVDPAAGLPYILRYQVLPVYNTNMLVCLLVVPGALLLLGRVRRDYPVKVFFLLFYFGASIVGLAGAVYFFQYPLHAGVSGPGTGLPEGLAALDAFNRWAMLLLGFSFLITWVAGRLARGILQPLTRLETTVYALLNNDDGTGVSDTLNMMSRREDELAMLSYAILLLGERLWEPERLFAAQFRKQMHFIGDEDPITDVYLVGLASLFGDTMLSPRYELPGLAQGGPVRGIDAVSLAVAAGGLQELAATYTGAGVQKALGPGLADDPSFTPAQRQHLALAVDLKLLFKGMLRTADFRLPLDEKLAWHLLYRASAYIGRDQRFTGYVTEPDIITRLTAAWEGARQVGSSAVDNVMTEAMSRWGITGYSVKRSGDLANFDPNFSFYYSHGDLRHLKQLTGMLIREGLQAKLFLEVKRSSFLYKDEWIPLPETAPVSVSPLGRILHCDEFDLALEFTDGAYRDRFKGMVEQYMRARDGRETPLLYQSWVTPLYFAYTPGSGGQRVDAVTVQSGDFQAYTYVSTGRAGAIITWLASRFPGIQVGSRPVWVNDTFYKHIQ